MQTCQWNFPKFTSKVYRAVEYYAHIQSSAAKLTVEMARGPEHKRKASKELPKTKKWNVLKWLRQSPDLRLIKLLGGKTECRKTQKWAATEGSCSKVLAKQMNEGKPAFGHGHVHRVQTPGSHWLERICSQVLEIIFIILLVCPATLTEYLIFVNLKVYTSITFCLLYLKSITHTEVK